MGGRKWQPGDVAMVLNEHGVWNRAICSVKPGGDVWQYGVADSTAPMDAEARPLAVLDPESAEQMERLSAVYSRTEASAVDNEEPMTMRALHMRAALLAYATSAEVFDHFPARNANGVTTSICGKAWRPDETKVSAGRCSECAAVVEAAWLR